jgi:hypothetical protein
MSSAHIAFIGLACVLGSTIGCGRSAPKALDASGKPVFDSSLVRHPAGTPYHCYKSVDARGDERVSCEVIQEWCVKELEATKARGRAVLSGCQEVDSAHCFAVYSSGSMIGGAKASCFETAKDCDELGAKMAEGMGKDNVSSCQMLDRSFEPKS